MKNKIKVLALLVALVLVVGAATYITQQEEPVEPTMSEVETPVEAPVETPIEGDAAVEGQPAADETSATGNLGGSVGENNFGMTNLMDSIKDNDQTDVEHSLDLEEEKQETPVEGAVGGSDGTGTGTQTGSGTQPPTQVPSQPQTNPQPQTPSNPQSQVPSDGKYSSKEAVESLDSVKEVVGYDDEIGAWEIAQENGGNQFMLPDGTTMDPEFLDIFFPDRK